MFGTDKSLRPPVNHKKVAAKGVIRKVLVKPSNNKNGRPVVDSPKTLDQTSTRKSQDRGKTKSIRQSKGKNEGKDDGKGTRRL